MQRPGQTMPLPDWYGVAAIAERWNTPPDAVLDAPIYWVIRTRELMAAEAFVAAEARRQH